MTRVGRGEAREVLRDAGIVLRKEGMLCRSLAVQLFTALIPSFVLLLMQIVPFAYVLLHPGVAGPVWDSILGSVFESATATVGPALILITATSLGSVTIARDRFGGSLEGTLASPLSTEGLWVGKTLIQWAAGALFYAVLCLALWGCSLLMPASGLEIGWREGGVFLGEALLLLLTTLLLVALVTLVQLGAPPAVAVIATTTPMVAICLLSYYLIDRLFKGRPIAIAPELIVRVELLAIPALLVLGWILAPRLLRREAILLKSR